ncbi:MAG TPA: hypothetical protein VE860_14650, partial [Chthoniobacterales bacterium]|nr:hypothetical protein [Chthoniobacterales bacterium]
SLPHIRAQDFADHVVDLMADKLARLPENTQVALRQLACLGNSAKIATLKLVRGDSEEAIHGLGNQSLDYPRPWRTPLGEHKSLPRCNFSVRLADSQ